ncbi:conserved hypothetical protein [Culex quinquefasciatus]|uniref:Uncharacterized protein n=1 Tax=Culex quinquefasciatus TaxID=7176 RepID=B0WJJ6_CULQU|nr:conserved hypothetical protein [Culex quinquefasciatus]|eukprot:XP_001848880.1 conserved hypothetical protein [Culex quinquefasciatus]
MHCSYSSIRPEIELEQSSDTSPNFATDLLKSPRLQYVVKYVIYAPYRPEMFPKKPLILPSAKTLDDFNKFGLSFRYDLDLEPFAVNHPVIGKYVVHDTFYYEVEHTEPGVALYVSQSVVKLLPALSYDFERGKTWFVELEQKFLVYPVQIYYTGVRSRYLETFRFTHVVLREAGILDWWEWQFAQRVVKYKWGSRPRGADDGKKYLVFDDMWMAWIVLSFGCVYTAKYVVQGSYRPETLPKKPLLVVMYPGPSVRSQYLETFRFTHIALREAGIMDWWQWRFGQYEVRRRLGLRQRGVDDGKMFLVFDDMLLAWIVLAIGSGSGSIGFIALNHLTKTNSTIIATAVTSTREIPFP